MGFYSSWAMLAITHHLIVRWAAYLEGYNPKYFVGYAILGDDIVIMNRKVASRYKWIMTELGVAISLAKSYESHNVVEFAKSLFVDGTDVSPLS